ncbi:MAG: hypothetical protein ACQEUZ_09915 [Pseudomonadota bacterium]
MTTIAALLHVKAGVLGGCGSGARGRLAMEFELDLAKPTVVLTGAWNPAIFTPEWIAFYLFKIEEGRDIEVDVLHDVESSRRIIFIGEIGVSVSNGRLEVYAKTEDRIPELSQFIPRIFEVLPHTPSRGLGVNFRYSSQNPSAQVIEKLETSEGFDLKYEVRRTELKSQLIRSENSVLNLLRISEEGGLVVDFNFHFIFDSKEKISSQIAQGEIESCKTEAWSLLSEHYEAERAVASGFRLEGQQKAD